LAFFYRHGCSIAAAWPFTTFIVALATYYNPYTLLLHEEINAHWLNLSSAPIGPNHAKMSGSMTAKMSRNHVTNFNIKLQHQRQA
jgi:hypothetical protein